MKIMFRIMCVLMLVATTAMASAMNEQEKRQEAKTSLKLPQVFLGVDNSVTLRGPIDDASAQTTMIKLAAQNIKRGLNNYPIYLVLDSPGGGIDAGNSLIQYAKTIKNLHTITIFSASMAAAIVETLPGNRYITENGILMFHRAKGGVSGQLEDGEVETRLDMIKRLVRAMEVKNATRMKMTLPDYKLAVKDELWLQAEDSVSKNATDLIMDIRCTDELITRTEAMLIDFVMFSIRLEFSRCPLFRNPLPFSNKKEQDSFLKLQKEIYEKLRGVKLTY